MEISDPNPKKQLNRDMSLHGYGERTFWVGGRPGHVLKVLIGRASGSRVLTFEQQPNHEPRVFIHPAFYRGDYAHQNRADLNHRPEGNGVEVPVGVAGFIVSLAYDAGRLPGGEAALTAVESFGEWT